MGMFDSLYVPCPKCNTDVEFQSKGGHCVLASYTLDNVPTDVFNGIRREGNCEGCGYSFKVDKTFIKKQWWMPTNVNGTLTYPCEGRDLEILDAMWGEICRLRPHLPEKGFEV